MVGIGNRSGGHNKKTEAVAHGSGSPESPRELSPRARHFFEWLVDRLGASEDGAGWSRADGSLLASVAETLESEEILGELIRQSPDDIRLHRMRGQMADRIVRVSNLIGLCPRDRSKLPAERIDEDESPFSDIMRRMAKG
jgi:phage terminase small subunit